MTNTTPSLVSLINKYNVSGPRYTSYPTALQFKEDFNPNESRFNLKLNYSTPLSLYIHIPFCHQLCYYCGCNKVVTRHQSKAEIYLDYLEMEITKVAGAFRNRALEHVHLGGGTPTFLTAHQMTRLVRLIRENFNVQFTEETEWCVEIDPRSIDEHYLDVLRELGFNRLSYGLQDFDFDVQTAINRVQDFANIKRLFARSRELGFESINADLIYGLPHQSAERFNTTIERLLELSPDRVSVFNYAHLPSKFAAQRKIKDNDLPTPATKIEIFTNTINKLESNGYQYIGIDHFAKESDSLAVAQNQKKLHRNFQGYTTHRDTDLLGLGVSAISQIGDVMMQNSRDIKGYYDSLTSQTEDDFLQRIGFVSSEDDIRRAYVIKELMCHYEISFSSIEKALSINPQEYFKDEFMLLEGFLNDGILQTVEDGFQVTRVGMFFIRNIAMCFDKYLAKQLRMNQYSRVI